MTPERRAEIDRQTVVHAIRLVIKENPDMPVPGAIKRAWVAIVESQLQAGVDPQTLTHCVMAWSHQYRTERDLRGRTAHGMWLGIVRNQTKEFRP